MEQILVIYDSAGPSLSSELLLQKLGYSYSLASIGDTRAEFISATAAQVVIFELSTADSACITILEKLNTISEISGMKKRPILVIAEEALHMEKAVRSAFSNFFFVKPVIEDELGLAIKHALATLK